MAEKRRGSPCSMLSLKAHAFSVEALIGAEKQQQLQKKRRKLGVEEAAVAVDDGGCSRGGGAGEKGSSEGDEGAALPPPAGAASGPARSCADLERSCGSRGAAGESALSRLTSSLRVPLGPAGPHGRAEPELLRVKGARARCAPRCLRQCSTSALALGVRARSSQPPWPLSPLNSGRPPDGKNAAPSPAFRAAAAPSATRAFGRGSLRLSAVQVCAFRICLPWGSSQWVLFFLS